MAPIFLIHWGSENEYPELGDVELFLDAEWEHRSVPRPSICASRVTESSPNAFLDELDRAVADPNLQLLYISAHGTREGLHYQPGSPVGLTYSQLGQKLGKSACTCIHVVFGSCHAMDSSTDVGLHLPECVSRICGFTDVPDARSVAALIAGIILDEDRLFLGISGAIQERLGPQGLPYDEALPKIIGTMKATLEGHSPQVDALVLPDPGALLVRTRVRNPDGLWGVSQDIPILPGE